MINESDDAVRRIVDRLLSEEPRKDDSDEGDRWAPVFADVMDRFGGPNGVQFVAPGVNGLDVLLREPDAQVEGALRSRYGYGTTISYGYASPT